MAKRIERFNRQNFQEEVARELGIDLNTADQSLHREIARRERIYHSETGKPEAGSLEE